MKKQVKKQIFKLVLLLLSVVLVFTGAVVAAFAAVVASSTSHTLTINFDEYVTKCEVTYEINQSGGKETKVIASGESITIFDGASVKVRFELVDGKGPNLVYSDTAHRATQAGNVIEWTSFVADNVVTVSCTDLTYTIHALNSNGDNKLVTGQPYDYLEVENSTNTVDDLTSGVVKYRINSDEEVELPRVQKTNWIFKGWYIVTNATDPAQNGGYFIAPVSDTGPCYMPKVVSMTSYMHQQNGIIYVYPCFVPEGYSIYREDWVYKESGEHRQTQLFSYEMKDVPVDSWYSAIKSEHWEYWDDDKQFGGYKPYSGYLLMEDCVCTGECDDRCIYAAKKVYNTKSDPDRNTVYRYYTPILYSLIFDLNDNGDISTEFNPATSKYLYGNRTEITVPSRVGYSFSGWKVEVYKNGQWTSENVPYLLAANGGADDGKYLLGTQYAKYEESLGVWRDDNAVYASEAQEDGSYEIRLIAQWTPIDIHIEYDLDVDFDLITNTNKNDFLENGAFTTFKFDAGIVIDNPTRVGWIFTGWTLTYSDGSTPPASENNGLSKINENQYQLAASLYAKDIVLKANWQAKTFTVEFGNLEGITNSDDYTKEITGVIYDQSLTLTEPLVVPSKTGYTFAGYYAADGVTKYINADGSSNCNKWDIDSDSETITLYAKWEANPCNVTVKIDGLPSTTTATIKVITASGEEKVVENGETIILPYDTVFHVEIAMLGNFRVVKLSCNSTDVTFSGTEAVTSGNVTVNAETVTLTAIVRPASLEEYRDVMVSPANKDTELKVDFKEHITNASDYEVAISQKDDLTAEEIEALNWHQISKGTNSYLFENLEAGTYYSVFIRVKANATENTYSGIILKVRVFTKYDEHIESAKNDLASKLTNDDVTNCYANKVIGDALKAINDKVTEWRNSGSLPDDFQAQIDKLVNEAKAAFEVAQLKDSKLVEWRDLYFAYEASKSFDEARKAELLKISDEAEAALRNATTKDDINKAFNDAKAEIEKVPVTYLYDSNKVMTLESLLGLGQSSGITLTSIEDINALRRAISDAIAQGRITADSFITIEEATKLLRTLETVSAYNFNLINVQMSEGDIFTLRMTIPESLTGRTGYQVAYFNQATGVLELLETKLEGNTLVFQAKHIADFVILADPTVDLTVVIIALGAILLCQLIAIALVLISRNKAKNSVMHASVALPVFLTIHFLPVANAEFIALGLGVAVLLAQIVLMWLLLSSGMIRVFKTKKTTRQKREVTAVVREEDLHEDPYAAFKEAPVEPIEEPVEEAHTEEEITEEEVPTEELIEEDIVEEVLDEDDFDEELAQELAREQEEEAEEELQDVTEEVYDDEEFIEPAPNPYYSLDEEEKEYAFDEEEAERVSDVDTSDTETEETPYGDDPLDGVFGETDVQYGDSGDEGERSSDEDSYAESYEYGDEENASHAETEEFDREETEGQGTVDPAAYLVTEEEEEISEDEEMYRYDE